MSINSLTSAAVHRSLRPPAGAAVRDFGLDVAPSPTAPPTRAANAIDALIKYIPTESIMLYLATVALFPALQQAIPDLHLAAVKTVSYWAFGLGVTPLIFVLVLFAKRREANLAPLPPTREFPWWEFVAATVAFLVWALVIPNGPFSNNAAIGVLGAFLALFVSMLLNLLERALVRNAT